MAIDVVIPALGESITEATVGEWLKKPGDAVKADEPIVSLETDKVAVEVPAPSAGVLSEQLAAVGDTVNVGAVIARLEAGGAAAAPAKAAAPKAAAPAKAAAAAEAKQSPAVTVALAETGVDAANVQGTGKDGRLTKADVRGAATAPAPAAAAPAAGARQEERVRMTRLRQTIARRLKEAQNTAAMLTTFNDVDMTAVMEARDRYKDMFEKKHGVRLGFMSFFTKACCLALKDVPSVNAAIEGDEIVYRNYADIGVAVSSPGGLVVPILRNADALSFAETEKAIGDFGRRARDGQLKIEELQGGTFTISNGGVFGSLLSTPILNPPQSGVLGMHRIEERPVVRDGQIVVRPMMYLALSYDHRLIDGREAVTFLVRVKEALEDPTRLVLDL
ncbi:2-oxoglutarate dehydrogenase complex dihydrolipoyllysine-residue succinyltransferase [Sphingosinicella xenopeptidilytica]|uniref:Dihydrolipoyllysine-residue succinyltransferase component of 2-oxoglutarate dehydrogenase complex n=1 Tax=Sphingosinicella xenopeptidilytica TaxID=364098 RepID=A0ABW3C2S2_SPHXN